MRQGIKIRSEVLNEIVCSSVRTNSDKSQEGQYWSNDTRTKVGKLMCWSVCQLVEHDWKRIVAAFCALRHAEQVLLEGELIRQTVAQERPVRQMYSRSRKLKSVGSPSVLESVCKSFVYHQNAVEKQKAVPFEFEGGQLGSSKLWYALTLSLLGYQNLKPWLVRWG